jgi:hypothetical protein
MPPKLRKTLPPSRPSELPGAWRGSNVGALAAPHPPARVPSWGASSESASRETVVSILCLSDSPPTAIEAAK